MKVQEDFNMTGKPNKKYSPEFKKEAVEKYLSGLYGGYDLLSKELGLRSSRQVLLFLILVKLTVTIMRAVRISSVILNLNVWN